MQPQPQTLFQILGVEHDASQLEIRKEYQRWVVRVVSSDQGIPAEVETAYRILSNPETRADYVRLLKARENRTPLLQSQEKARSFRQFCNFCFLEAWECPEGLLGESGIRASLGEIYVVITLLGEAPPWANTEEPRKRNLLPLAIAASFVLTIVGGIAAWGWYEFVYVPQAPQRLAAAIRRNDVAMSDLLTAVRKNETDFEGEMSAVIGTLPTDGSMPDDLARVCFKEKTAARAWEEIKNRNTFQSDLAPFDSTLKTIESRITMGTFVEEDKKAQEEAVPSLQAKANSFTELRSDLDLLRVLLEAERLPRPGNKTLP